MAWELFVKRIENQEFNGRFRTISQYELFIDGAKTNINGYMCEPIGPSSNDTFGNRIGVGRYPLSTQFGRYVSIDFEKLPIGEYTKMPGFRLLETGNRSDILVHTAHTKIGDSNSDLWLSSIGCFNPTNKIAADEEMDFNDTWTRTSALIESLKAYNSAAFLGEKTNMAIENAYLIVEDEI